MTSALARRSPSPPSQLGYPLVQEVIVLLGVERRHGVLPWALCRLADSAGLSTHDVRAAGGSACNSIETTLAC